MSKKKFKLKSSNSWKLGRNIFKFSNHVVVLKVWVSKLICLSWFVWVEFVWVVWVVHCVSKSEEKNLKYLYLIGLQFLNFWYFYRFICGVWCVMIWSSAVVTKSGRHQIWRKERENFLIEREKIYYQIYYQKKREPSN